MSNNSFETQQYSDQSLAVSKNFMSSVFSWMFLALLISTGMAYAFSHSLDLFSLLIDTEAGKMNIFGYVVMFAPILFVIAMGAGFNRFSYSVLVTLFLIY